MSAAKGNIYIDVDFWGGLIPSNQVSIYLGSVPDVIIFHPSSIQVIMYMYIAKIGFVNDGLKF